MARYVLRPLDGSTTFQKICQGRKWVGRVYFDATTDEWVGRIGQGSSAFETRSRVDAVQAFRTVASLALGFSSVAHLKAHNSDIRRANRARRDNVRFLQSEMLRRLAQFN